MNKENIPTELVDELKTYYKEIDFSNYHGELYEGMSTQKIKYRSSIDENHEMTYVIRGSYDGNKLRLYAILPAGPVLRK